MNRARAPLLLLLGGALAAAPVAFAQDGGAPGGALGGGNGKDPAGGAGKPPNDDKAPLPVRVNQAIDSGVRWLQGKNTVGDKVFLGVKGNWSPEVTGDIFYDPNGKGDPFVHPTGCTSLALYALLKCGVPKDDPVIKKGFEWLRGTSGGITKGGKIAVGSYRVPNGTYELAVLILAIEAKANPHKLEAERERDLKFRLKKGEKLNLSVKLEPEDQTWMKDLVTALRSRIVTNQGWRYGLNTGTTGWNNGNRSDKDLSATNLAMLALAAAERCGFKQEDAVYASVLKWTLSMQEKDGPEVKRWDPSLKTEDAKYAPAKDHARGFGYLGANGPPPGVKEDDRPGVPPEFTATGSMTCCGLGNLVICTTFLEARESTLFTGELAAASEKAWWDGVAWLDDHWSVSANPNRAGYHYYYLYCLERACDLKRIHLLASHPWYNEGAQVLVDDQVLDPSGAWTKQDTHKPCSHLNTCFALLFLNRSTPAITGD